MKGKDTVTVRYIGADRARRFVLQRADYKFWAGDGWDAILDNAKVFSDHGAARNACAAIQYERYKGKPLRSSWPSRWSPMRSRTV